MVTKAVFITTCSKNKVGWGLPYGKCATCITVPDSLLKVRNELYESLRRQELEKLRGAIQGPDFVRASHQDGVYLPAHVRYSRGQFMTSLEIEFNDYNTLKLWLDENRLFFISGLYGIVPACEPIQNYDVELGALAEEHWQRYRSLLTDCLLGFLERGYILLDCCGELKYSKLINWHEIEKHGFQIFHAVDPQREGAQVRAETGTLAANVNDKMLEGIINGTEFAGVNAVIRFVNNTEFLQRPTSLSGHLPLVGVIDTGLNEFSDVTKEAKRQDWDRHFKFEGIASPAVLKTAYQHGIKQCICLIPEDGHDYLVKWCKGKQPRDVYGHELLKVRRPIDLVLWFKDRP